MAWPFFIVAPSFARREEGQARVVPHLRRSLFPCPAYYKAHLNTMGAKRRARRTYLAGRVTVRVVERPRMDGDAADSRRRTLQPAIAA